jgi:hypothetical protein
MCAAIYIPSDHGLSVSSEGADECLRRTKAAEESGEDRVVATVLYCVAYVTSQQGSYRSSSSAVLAHTGYK